MQVADAATIDFTGSAISGANFSGGPPSLTSSTIAKLNEAQQNCLNGAFSGLAADEASVAIVIDYSASGTLTAVGTALANKVSQQEDLDPPKRPCGQRTSATIKSSIPLLATYPGNGAVP